MTTLEILTKRLEREKKARKNAEKLLEQKALELYRANQQLKNLNNSLQQEVEKKTSEIEIQKSRLSIILQSLQEGILVEDQFRKVILINQTFCDLFGIPQHPDALIGIDCALALEQSKDLFLEPNLFVTTIDQMLENKVIAGPVLLDTKDGRILELSYIPIHSQSAYIGHLWRYKDKTEKISIDNKIRQSEEKYRSIMENMELGLMEVDAEGTIMKVYDRFCQMMGYEPVELLGKNAGEVFLPEAFIPVMQKQNEDRKKGKSGAYEIQMKTKSGALKWILISGAPFFDDDKQVKGSIGIHYDISPQKELQSALEAARQEAIQARDAEKEFLANMSHEIRNPINSIIGMTSLLYDTNPSKEQLEYVDHISFSANILLSLVSDILDISKITEGKMELNEIVFDPRELLNSIASTVKFRLKESPVQFKVDLPETMPEALLGDTTILNQIFFNLLGNAIKFTEAGSILLAVKILEEDEDSIQLLFKVEDTGIGIPAEKQKYIFERFGQAGIASKAVGTGLGLPITKELIGLMGSTIHLESEVEKGSRFSFPLAFAKVPEQHLGTYQASELETSKNKLGLHVLIVEDNDTNRLYLEKLLDKWQYTYKSSINGALALEALQQERFDLILMDIRMPILDGYETTIRLRSSLKNPNRNTPVIALTASALLDEKEKALAAGMDFHLTKPFTAEMLANAIGNFFQTVAPNMEDKPTFKWPPPLNAEELEELYESDLIYAHAMFGIFDKNIDQEIQLMEQFMQEEQWKSAANLCHKVKPNFKMVGMGKVSEALGQMETLLHESDRSPQQKREFWETIKTRIQPARQEIARLIPILNTYI